MSKRFLVLILFLTCSFTTFAQRVSYPELVFRADLPEIFIDDLVFPADSNSAVLAFTFRFNYDFLPFKKIPFNNELSAPEGAQFFTSIRLNSEIFDGHTKRRDIANMQSVNRDFWADTLFTETYEATASDDNYASGALETTLETGNYNYILQLSMMQEQSERNTQRRNINIPDFTKKKTGEIYLIREKQENGGNISAELMNLNDNVLYGENFYALIRIPDFDTAADYEIAIHQARVERRDTTTGKEIHSQPLSKNEIYENTTLSLQKSDQPELNLVQKKNSFTYALVEIPNSEFENSAYFIRLKKSGQEKPIASKFFRSYWPDMPASLYNLNIAIDNLKFIVDKNELDRLKNGNQSERERKFREFWESKDPTPKTVFNELMAEYYRRIDYAFKEFGSQENPMGHENDQGEIYIKFGPPDSTERVFPTNDQVREIWKYPTQTFVFEASSGFGDFVLIGTK